MAHCVGGLRASKSWLVPLCFAAGLTALAGPVLAASSVRNAASNEKQAAAAKAIVYGPLIALVSLNDQKVTIWSENGALARSSVSSGMSGHRTPTGVFSVIGKERYHESNLYSNAPMPFMQRITWSGVALHAGNLPGYPASHGCIRLPGDFAERLFGMTRMGMRVVVTDHDTAPFPIVHANLPSPTFVREAQVTALVAPTRAHAATSPSEGRMQLGGPTEQSERLLNPMERGKLEQGVAKAAALEAQADAEALLEIAQRRGVEARTAVDALRAAEATLAAAAASREKVSSGAALATASTEERARDEAARVASDAAFASALQHRNEARVAALSADAAAFDTAAEAKAAVAERDALEYAARVADRATEPVSVFVSKKLHRVFVRQGFEPVFEADVEILEPQDPLGTHVFTAMAAPTDSGAMKWVAVTVPEAGFAEPAKPKSSKTAAVVAPERTSAQLPPNAANALTRVKFSDEVSKKISEKLWLGASLIISDYGVSEETGKGTDFVVLTRSSSRE